MTHRPRAHGSALLLVALLAGAALAEDTSTPREAGATSSRLDVESESADFDQSAGTITFIGNVVATRGETRLTGERLHAYQQDEELERAELEGEPGTFHHVDDEGETVEGEARRIVYQPAAGRLDLYDNAHVVRGRETFSGDHIRYYLDEERISAAGEGSGRVRTTLYPEREEDEGE
ncbi:MAG: lipopolysaccharide transport periplasmic protein LptA [Pseudomonadota bacterium]